LDVPRPLNLPASLGARFDHVAERLSGLDCEATADIVATVGRVTVVSDFVLSVLLRQPEQLMRRLQDPGALTKETLLARIDIAELGETEAMAALRRIRNVELARLAWRDLAGWADLDSNLQDLSTLAEAMVQVALEHAAARLAARFGCPRDRDGRAAPLLVLAMGKLGGRELNFSSDIDLVWLYPEGLAFDGPSNIEVEEYFRRLAQSLIKLLDEVTEDGFVYRVDTRLRPFGASGPLVVSVAALESYLVRHGRDWERYAYVKARLITGEDYRSEVFDQILTPFVYRRYIDYGVFDALRQMKRLISQEVARKDMAGNIKLGPGGIREIEFIVQVFQLIRGGREPDLRTSNLKTALRQKAEKEQIGADAVTKLVQAYEFLRTLENRLQAMTDHQTHDLPQDAAHAERLAYAMNAGNWPALDEQLSRHRRNVETEFNRVAWDADSTTAAHQDLNAIRTAWEAGTLTDALRGTRLAQDAEVVRLLTELRGGGLYRRMDEISRQRLADVVIRMISSLESQQEPSVTLARLLPVLRAICRRSAYLSLLTENPQALKRLLSVASQSAMLAQQVSEHPLLLDELLDARLLDKPPTREELVESLRGYIGNRTADDVEASLDAMRQFQRAAVFRIAIADRFGRLPLMKVSDRLTDTAELVLQLALDMAWKELVVKYGLPTHGDSSKRHETGFAIIGYGKLGGLELGYGSDLDLVFLHDSSGEHQETDGSRPLDNQRFFARLAQRLIHFLSIQTSSGRLYEVDTRLRPSGASGLLVASLGNFQRYQREEAWIWEHQALLRSRSVAGADTVRRVFERERLDILINHVDRARLKVEVEKMRRRMRTELSQGKGSLFDIKQDTGGLADIEFLIDYWVLSNAREYPELVEFPDNIRQLEAIERVGLESAERCRRLKEAYLAFRQRIHELALNEQSRVVAATEFEDLREWITSLWNEAFG